MRPPAAFAGVECLWKWWSAATKVALIRVSRTTAVMRRHLWLMDRFRTITFETPLKLTLLRSYIHYATTILMVLVVDRVYDYSLA